MKETHWMMFRPEHANVVFFWNGEELMVVFHDLDPDQRVKDWFWSQPADDVPNNTVREAEKLFLQQVATKKGQRVFLSPRDKSRYQVIQRGVFETTETLTNG